MEQQATLDILYVAAFFLGGLGFAVGPFIISFLLAPRSTRNTKEKTKQLIECGMEPIGDAWIRFGIVYYLYALMFVAFAVDILFLFPVALVYNQTGQDGLNIGDLRAFVEILIFVGILSLIIIYAWKKGVFKWERKIYNQR
ncbi:MAG: NADH-quinone oxidoreductase subunit A [Proteobacteria bacterium]|nr:NADH-quinone oxidoreductase subunit A [Pseudomonadota bacterium]MBU1546029.1 NADH-quinone oxidoreductase subunit A [Pseudomonadota bacterium]MBU2620406.1 NADH-quinone oxidoreductase subunit A [Pseudomonadota bacterium]